MWGKIWTAIKAPLATLLVTFIGALLGTNLPL